MIKENLLDKVKYPADLRKMNLECFANTKKWNGANRINTKQFTPEEDKRSNNLPTKLGKFTF